MADQTAHTNRKAELLSKPVEHIDITQYDARPLVEAMGKMSFTSRDTARAAEIYNRMLADRDCSVILTLAGSTSAGGCMHVYRDLVAAGMVDAIVATGASIIDMDFFEALASAIIRAVPPSMIMICAIFISIGFMTPSSMRKNCRPVIMCCWKSLIACHHGPIPAAPSSVKWAVG